MNLLAVNFHYFRETSYTSGIYPTSPAALEKQLDALSRQFEFVSQSILAGWVREKVFPAGNYCHLTFDDGLREQMAAFDLLWSKGIPATFYVTSNPVRYGKVLPTHQLHYIRTRLTDRDILDFLEKNSRIDEHVFDEQLLENQYRYDEPPARRVKFFLNFVLPEKEKENLIGQMFRSLVPDEAAFARDLYVGEQEIRRLAEAGALGAHGSTHQPLAALPDAEAEEDIRNSVQYLETVGGRPVLSFAYPFGGEAAVSPSLAPMLERAGIQFAFTMKRGTNRIAEFQTPFFLRRIDTKDVVGMMHDARTHSRIEGL